MDDNAVYQYLKLILENVSVWQVLVLALVIALFRRPERLEKIPKYISRFKVGDLEVELREIKEELKQTKEQVEVLENDLENSRFESVLGTFDAHGPVAELDATRRALKDVAASIEDLAPVRAGLGEGASADQLYAAAEVARTRRDPALFDDLVACLERLAPDPDLGGVRLHTVWTLTSALHKTLISDIRPGTAPRITPAQLERAQEMLKLLNSNPRVRADRPDDPMKGVRGPTKWAGDWIRKGLARADAG